MRSDYRVEVAGKYTTLEKNASPDTVMLKNTTFTRQNLPMINRWIRTEQGNQHLDTGTPFAMDTVRNNKSPATSH